MDFKGKKAAFYTLGCKLNFSETSSIAHQFERAGFERVGFKEKADVYVVNSCTVTAEGDKKSRNIIRSAIRNNPGAVVVVTGCYAQLQPDKLKKIAGLDYVIGAEDKFRMVELIGDLCKPKETVVKVEEAKRIRSYFHAFSYGDRTRSFLKIQDGCDYFCTYCAIPYARGRSRNDSIANTVKKAEEAIAKGTREIILSGVNIGDFGKSTGETFIGLLKAIHEVEGLQRIRISSVEPNLLTDEIIELAARSGKIMPHFHLPLQSGSDEVLKLMKRKYRREVFADRVRKIKSEMPHAFIGVDLIAGTNGETEEFFLDSFNFIREQDVSELHAFPYSERPGTRALSITPVVPVDVRKQRVQKLINLSEKKLRHFYEAHLGTEQIVLFEDMKDKGSSSGFTENYIRVETAYSPELANQVRKVRLEEILPNGHVKGALV
ncbi:MAG: tRNA (N(6)-L-threonylcarbamoyladenosine(37)-C(2))-methylthiotransferase MtaB [Prolixibacteraceae bacterium]|jgi:threonylcarbamoyladenosine tRNA methylthiotransferase MtaB|nr:tRNA (N(6)-L-threonylcarbamoyladenosine(37)-C(2))-methylthiotransferase MtaB [Prolixibacteraceae bacterium]